MQQKCPFNYTEIFFQKVHTLSFFNTRKEAYIFTSLTKHKRLAGHFKKNENVFSDGFKINLFIAEILEFHLALSLHGSVEAYRTYQEGLSQGIPFCEPQQWICL